MGHYAMGTFFKPGTQGNCVSVGTSSLRETSVPRGTQPNGLNADGSKVLSASELRDSRSQTRYIEPTVQSGFGAFLRNATPERPHIDDLTNASTAASTPEKREDICDSRRFLEPRKWDDAGQLFNDKALNTFLRAVDFFTSEEDTRRACSEILGPRDLMLRWRAQSRLDSLQKQGLREISVRELMEKKDSQRVRRGECGIMKFAVMLGRGQLSIQDSQGYWNTKARESKHNVLQFFHELVRVAHTHMTEHQRSAVAISLDRNRRLFDRNVSGEVQSILRALRVKGSLVDISPRMIAQSGFASVVDRLTQPVIDPVMQRILTHIKAGIASAQIPSVPLHVEWPDSGVIVDNVKNTFSNIHTPLLSYLDGQPGMKEAFFVRTMTFMAAYIAAPSLGSRVMAFCQYVTSFDSTVGVIVAAFKISSQSVQRSFTRHADSMIAQSGTSRGDDDNLISYVDQHSETIYAAFCNALCSVFAKESTKDTLRTSLRVKRLSNVSTACTSVASVVSLLYKLIEHVWEYAQAWSRNMDYSTFQLCKIAKDLPDFVRRVMVISKEDGVNRAAHDGELATEISHLMSLGITFRDHIFRRGSKLDNGQVMAFEKVMSELQELHKAAKRYFATHYKRTVPFCVHLIGAPGVGKTTLLSFLGPKCCKWAQIPYTMYNRNFDAKHWEGYSGDSVTVFDDFLQVLDPKVRAAQCREFIDVVNDKAYFLNMADVTRKGNTLFESPFVFVTSNYNIPPNLGVSSVDAIKRRRNVVAKVKVRAEFRDSRGMLDRAKVATLEGAAFSTDIYEFSILNRMTGKTERVMAYPEFIKYVKSEYKHHSSEQYRISEEKDRAIKAACESSDSEDEMPDRMMAQGNTNEVQSPLVETPPSDVSSEPALPSLPAAAISTWGNRLFHPESVTPEGVGSAHSTDSEESDSDLEAELRDAFITNSDWDEPPKTTWEAFKAKWMPIWTKIPKLALPEDPVKREQVKVIGSTLALIGGGLMLYKIYTSVSRNKDTDLPQDAENMASEAFASGDQVTTKPRVEYKFHPIPQTKSKGFQRLAPHPSKMEAQASRDPRANELITAIYSRMMCKVVIQKSEGRPYVHGLLIGGKNVLVPYHFIATIESGCWMEVHTTFGGRSVYKVEVRDILVNYNFIDRDIAIIKMPNTFPSFPKAIQHFVQERDLATMHLGEVHLLSLAEVGESFMLHERELGGVTRQGPHDYTAIGEKVRNIRIIESLMYRANTVQGDCGSPLVWFNPSASRKILGFHVAGGQSRGAATVLTYEFMQQVLHDSDTQVIEIPDHDDTVLPTLKEGLADIGQSAYIGLVSPNKQVRQPKETDIIPSPIHGSFPIICKPARLTHHNGVSPLELGVRKAFEPTKMLPEDDMVFVRDQIVDHIMSLKRPMELRILTLSEGLNGVEGCKQVRSLNMTTSPGYPWILESRKSKGKRDFVEYDGNKWVPLPSFAQAIEQRIDLAKKGQIPETIFVDVLKDERREIEKVDACKTRIFNTCPMDLTVAIRMYFSAFAAILMHNSIQGECAVGINYHSTDWEMLYRRLAANGSNWIAGDYSNYDKTFPRRLMMLVAEIANYFYNDGNDLIRLTLMETLASRIHICERVLYFSPHGNPSGNPLTTIINSIGNMALMRLAWMDLARKNDPMLELDFAEYVSLSVYGDDNVATVSPITPWYNMVNIAHTMRKWGVTYTPPKIGDVEWAEYVPRDKVSYLKRFFHSVRGRIRGPLPKERIRDTLNWVRKSPDDVLALKQNIEATCIEMSHWGEEEYRTFTREVRHACAVREIPVSIKPFDYYWDECLAGRVTISACEQGRVDPLLDSPTVGGSLPFGADAT